MRHHEALLHGTYSNNTHVLVPFTAKQGGGPYKIVVSPLKRKLHQAVNYTLSAYCSISMEFNIDPPFLRFHKTLVSQWTGVSAGGSRHYASYSNNPQYALDFRRREKANHVRIRLRVLENKGEEVPVKVVLMTGTQRLGTADVSSREIVSSGDYTRGIAYIDIFSAVSECVVVVSTFDKDVEAKFELIVESSLSDVEVKEM